MSRSTMSIPRQSRSPRFTRTWALPTWALPVCLAMLASTALAQTAAETFAKAKRTEIQNASAKQALPLYELVAQSQKATDTLKARALYRLSICYLKLEEYKKASDTLARLETSYPRSDQAVQARLLRKTLGASEKALEPRRDLDFEVQQILVDGTLGRRTEDKKVSARAALTRLDFLGDPAVPILRKALNNSNSTIRQIAMATLAQRGDEGIFSGLVAQAKSASFTSYGSALLRRSPKEHLVTLCRKNPGLLPRLKQAYVESTGNAKARLLTVFLTLRRMDLVPDYEKFLESDNELLRTTAWEAFTRSRDRQDPAACSEYLERLLTLWAKHSAYRASLARVMVQAHSFVRIAGEPMATRWETVLVQASKDDVPGLAQVLLDNYKHAEELRIPLRRALLASSSKKYAGMAMDYSVQGSSAEQEEDARRLVELAFAQAQAWSPRDPKYAILILTSGAWNIWRMSLEDWRSFMDRFLQKETLAGFQVGLDREAEGWLRDMFFYTFGGTPQGTCEPVWYEQRLPFLLRYGSADPEPVTLEGLCWGLDRRLYRGTPVSKEDMAKIKEIIFRIQDGKIPQGRFRSEIQRQAISLLKILARTPGGLTLEETMRRLDFSQNNRDRVDINPLIRRTRSQGGLVAQIEGMAKKPDVPVQNLLHCIEYARLTNKDKSAAYRIVWARSGHGERVRIMNYLPLSQENLAFVEKVFDGDVGLSLGRPLLHWIRAYEGPEQVSLLLRLLEVKSTWLKVEACKSLESSADPRAAPGLIDLLTWPDTGVRDAAEKALESIRNIDKNQKAWRDWYEGLKKKGK